MLCSSCKASQEKRLKFPLVLSPPRCSVYNTEFSLHCSLPWMGQALFLSGTPFSLFES